MFRAPLHAASEGTLGSVITWPPWPGNGDEGSASTQSRDSQAAQRQLGPGRRRLCPEGGGVLSAPRCPLCAGHTPRPTAREEPGQEGIPRPWAQCRRQTSWGLRGAALHVTAGGSTPRPAARASPRGVSGSGLQAPSSKSPVLPPPRTPTDIGRVSPSSRGYTRPHPGQAQGHQEFPLGRGRGPRGSLGAGTCGSLSFSGGILVLLKPHRAPQHVK